MKKQVQDPSPARLIPQVLGGLAGGVAGFKKARDEGKGIGRALLGGLAKGGLGALMPGFGLAQGIGTIAGALGNKTAEDNEIVDANPMPIIQGQAPADQALALAQGTNPITYKNKAIGKPRQAAMMMGVSNGLMPKGAMLG